MNKTWKASFLTVSLPIYQIQRGPPLGMEKISFVWYLKNISLLAIAGYFAGIGVFLLLV